jgi:hypothetical protein
MRTSMVPPTIDEMLDEKSVLVNLKFHLHVPILFLANEDRLLERSANISTIYLPRYLHLVADINVYCSLYSAQVPSGTNLN